MRRQILHGRCLNGDPDLRGTRVRAITDGRHGPSRSSFLIRKGIFLGQEKGLRRISGVFNFLVVELEGFGRKMMAREVEVPTRCYPF